MGKRETERAKQGVRRIWLRRHEPQGLLCSLLAGQGAGKKMPWEPIRLRCGSLMGGVGRQSDKKEGVF